MMFRLIRSVALNILGTLYSAREGSMISLPIVFALEYPWVHICTPNCHYIASNIKTPVDQAFSLAFTLNIPNINPDDGHV